MQSLSKLPTADSIITLIKHPVLLKQQFLHQRSLISIQKLTISYDIRNSKHASHRCQSPHNSKSWAFKSSYIPDDQDFTPSQNSVTSPPRKQFSLTSTEYSSHTPTRHAAALPASHVNWPSVSQVSVINGETTHLSKLRITVSQLTLCNGSLSWSSCA